jgi:phosphoglycolate phosphatase
MTSPVLLFDLDGTLLDPRHGIIACMRYAFDQIKQPCPEDDILASFIGIPLRNAFSSLLATEDQELIESALNQFRQRFADQGLYENHIYQGIPDMLEDAIEVASALFVATSKPTIYAVQILKHFGLEHYFRGIYGSELSGHLDNKADLLAHLLAVEEVSPELAVMIGDRPADIIAAKANTIRSIGVLWGYGRESDLIDAGADYLCKHPDELVTDGPRILRLL